MTRRSRRDLERAVEDLAEDSPDPEPCPDCGGMPPGYDDAQGVTVEFVTYECTCGRDDAAPGVTWSPEDA